MRTALNGLYRLSGVAAAGFLVAICCVVLIQVGLNLIDAVAAAVTGEAIGLVLPSYAEFAGFFLAASSFLALAYTLRHGGHIRVSLVLHVLAPPVRRVLELFSVLIGLGLSAYFFYFTVLLVLESIEFGDVSPGMVAVPLWIPQAAMATGLGVLSVAFLDEFVGQVRGAHPTYEEPVPSPDGGEG